MPHCRDCHLISHRGLGVPAACHGALSRRATGRKKTNAQGYKRKVSVPVCPTNNPGVRARCVFWPLLRYSHTATLGQQTRMRVHCGDFASYFLFHRGSGISSLPCGCYINGPPVRAGLITWFDARRAVVPHFRPPGFDVYVSTPNLRSARASVFAGPTSQSESSEVEARKHTARAHLGCTHWDTRLPSS